MRPSQGRVGLIAGGGELPLHIARSLSCSGRSVFVAGLKDTALPDLENPSWETEWVDFFRLGDLLGSLRNAGVSEVVLAGRVDHKGIFRFKRPDERMVSFFAGLEDRRGSTILSALVRLLMEEGYLVPSLIDLVPDLVPDEGTAAGPVPGPERIADLRLGWPAARHLADLDIGQVVIVKDGAMVAVEGMEGTDDTIRRALSLAGSGLTVVKRAAGDHDFRFDVPTIGKNTIEVLASGGEGAIAFEAGRCIILDPEGVLSLCDRVGVTLLACREGENGELFWASR